MCTIKLTFQPQAPDHPRLQDAIASAHNEAGSGDERWRLLWREELEQEHLSLIQQTKQSLPNFTNVLVLGIGGSSLGLKALHCALGSPSGTELFVLDNVDPSTFTNTISSIKENDPKGDKTVVVVISKSGETAEINALLMATQPVLPEATYIAVTGEKGTLQEYATGKGWHILPVPEGVGGRFSVLSPVGLLPAALCGINISELLSGARHMDDKCLQSKSNPAANLASFLVHALQNGKTTQVMMPYCDRLFALSQWYVQLWAESLGKVDRNGTKVGPTPMTAIGATDQHSMLQLWREGPEDKVIGFIEVAEVEDVTLGENALSPDQSWLCGVRLGSLLRAQREATEKAVQDAGQYTWTLSLSEINEHNLGQFIALWQDSVALAGRLLNLNAYDQPGVELGKHLTKQMFT